MNSYFWNPPEHRINKVEEYCLSVPRVLDVGGWWKPLRCATHVIDIASYETRGEGGFIGKSINERFSSTTWTITDICSNPFPYPDNFFDFVYCGQTLEDVRDPLAVCHEISRVGKRGLIEVPSIWIECQYGVDASADSFKYPGYERHRWLVKVADNSLLFIPKLVWLNGIHFVHPRDSKKLRANEALWTDEFWWEEKFEFSELMFSGREDILPILNDYFAGLKEKS